MLSLSQLKQETTRKGVVAWLIERLGWLGFQTTAWGPGRIQHSMLSAAATSGASIAAVAETIATGMYSETAEGAMLRNLSISQFNNYPEEAKKTEGPFRLTSASTSPNVIQPGQLIITDYFGTRFVNKTGGTLPALGTLDITVEAEIAGSQGNIPDNSYLTLVTQIAGVSVTNAIGTPWYTVTGQDPELTAETRRKNATKWGLLSFEKTSTAVEHATLKAPNTGISKVYVDATNPRGPNTTDVYVFGQSTPVGTAGLENCQSYMSQRFFGTQAIYPVLPAGYPGILWESVIAIKPAPTYQLNLVGPVYFDPQYQAAEVQAELEARLNAMIKTMKLGGKVLVSGSYHVIPLGDIYEVIETTKGVLSCTLSVPSGDITIGNYTAVMGGPWFGPGKLELISGVV